ncbi:hypothetical protein RSAG8_12673, partial [Rhizoctonia solani AG-8 WAC10335]
MDPAHTENTSNSPATSLDSEGENVDYSIERYHLKDARELMTRVSLLEWTEPELSGGTKSLLLMFTKLGQYQTFELNHRIPTPFIRHILLYSYRPSDYLDFASPMMISGLIKVLSAMCVPCDDSPFSCESGYACFRLIALGLGVCLIRKGQDLGLREARKLTSFKGLDLHAMSLHILRLVHELALATDSQKGWDDRIFGWSGRQQCQEGPTIISLTDAETLLTVYIDFQRSLNDQYLAKQRLDSFREVFWRCWLVTMHDQVLFKHMTSRIQGIYRLSSMEQSAVPIPADPEDSNELIGALIDRLTPPIDDTSYYDFLSLADLIHCIVFMRERIGPGCGVLLPQCFGAIIERLWYTISCQNESIAPLSEVLWTVIGWFRGMQELFELSANISAEPLMELIDEMIRTDFLSLVGRTMFLLKPSMDQSRNYLDFG